MNKIVSIIVPVYNAEKYIDRCLHSILNQSYTNIEIVLINDGSSDNSLKIINEYAKKYSFIKVYSHENKGVGFTRNFGILQAKGEYIVFVDSDDYIDENYVEILLNSVKNYDAVFSGYKSITENGEIISVNALDQSEWAKYKYTGILGKIYKTKYLIQNKIFYPNYKVGEDLYFALLVINKGAKILTIDYCGYNYVQNSKSVTNSLIEKYDMLPMFQDLYEKIHQDLENDTKLFHFYIKAMLYSIILQKSILSSKEMNEMFFNTMKWIKNCKRKIGIFNYKLESLKIRFFVNLFVFGYCIKINKILFIILKHL